MIGGHQTRHFYHFVCSHFLRPRIAAINPMSIGSSNLLAKAATTKSTHLPCSHRTDEVME